MLLWIWRHFRILLPDDWEMLVFSKEHATGRCIFADRYQHRLEFHWREVPGIPDFDRMMSDYESRLTRDKKTDTVEQSQYGSWHGLTARVNGVNTSRWGRYFAEEKCLVELVFLWPKRDDQGLTRTVLDSVQEEPELAGGLRRWRAFGMDFLTSAALSMTECTVKPGLARMLFRHAKDPLREERFERMGLVTQWLRVPIAEWLRKRTPATVRIRTQETQHEGAQAIEMLRGDRRAVGFHGMIGRRIPYTAAAWLCPADARIYVVTVSGRPVSAETASPSLRCSAAEGERHE